MLGKVKQPEFFINIHKNLMRGLKLQSKDQNKKNKSIKLIINKT